VWRAGGIEADQDLPPKCALPSCDPCSGFPKSRDMQFVVQVARHVDDRSL
jgi:hypothetical protein